MSQTAKVDHVTAAAAGEPETSFFLSEVLGARVKVAGKKVGKLQDLIIKENGSVPVVTHLFVSLPFGESAVVPWDRVATIDPKEIALDVENVTAFRGEPDESAVLLRDHILDKRPSTWKAGRWRWCTTSSWS